MIKKFSLFMVSVLLFMLVGCSNDILIEEAEVPNTQRPSIMLHGTLYFTTGRELEKKEIDEKSSYYVESVVPGSSLPKKDKEINFPCDNTQYIELESGVAILIDERWIIFEVDK